MPKPIYEFLTFLEHFQNVLSIRHSNFLQIQAHDTLFNVLKELELLVAVGAEEILKLLVIYIRTVKQNIQRGGGTFRIIKPLAFKCILVADK